MSTERQPEDQAAEGVIVPVLPFSVPKPVTQNLMPFSVYQKGSFVIQRLWLSGLRRDPGTSWNRGAGADVLRVSWAEERPQSARDEGSWVHG
jgi:hypothetical protein